MIKYTQLVDVILYLHIKWLANPFTDILVFSLKTLCNTKKNVLPLSFLSIFVLNEHMIVSNEQMFTI